MNCERAEIKSIKALFKRKKAAIKLNIILSFSIFVCLKTEIITLK